LENLIPVGGVMVRRAWLERTGGFDESMRAGEDWDLWLRLVVAGCQLGCVQKVVCAYRTHVGQMTQNAALMRAATLRVLDKVFNQPDLPSHWRVYENQAIAGVLVRSAARAFHSGEFEIGNNDLIEATKLDPGLISEGYNRLADILRGWASAPQTRDPEAYLLAISKHLPPPLGGLRRQLGQAIAAVILESLFGTSCEIWRARRKALMRAICYDPSWLLNRGVLRMLTYAWLTMPNG
jgi:hypothetical protein